MSAIPQAKLAGQGSDRLPGPRPTTFAAPLDRAARGVVILADRAEIAELVGRLARRPVAIPLPQAAVQAMDRMCGRKLVSSADLVAAALDALFAPKGA